SASSALRFARAESWPAVIAATRKLKNAIQFSGSAMWNVPTGGRKKKLKQIPPTSAASTAGPDPQAAATKRTMSKKASAAVVRLILRPKILRTAVATAITTTATRYPSSFLLARSLHTV